MLETELFPVEIVGVSPWVESLRQFTQRVARNSSPVMFIGEPGTGKQLAAQVLHEKSPRKKSPLLMIDCGLYYERELKRELFGYGGSGATGKERKGILELAAGGTCYLARTEELTPSIQESLLGFLKSGRFRRLGDGKEVASEARLIVSSAKNLEVFVRSGLFLEELFEVISEQSKSFLPLRERPQDVPALVEKCLEANAPKWGSTGATTSFHPEAIEALKCYPRPANFDELLKELSRLFQAGIQEVRTEHLAMEVASYWLGQRGNPETRKVLEELDGHIREFKILSQLGCEFGDPTIEDRSSWDLAHFEQNRDLLEE